MKHYHGYWPVFAIIKQYLSNIKKRFARDLKAEQDDAALPGPNESGDDSSHMTKRCHLDGSGKGGKAVRDEESEDEELEFEDEEFEDDDDDEDDEDETDEEDSDVTDVEDDKAEMDLHKRHGGALAGNSKQDDASDGERHKSNLNKGGIPPVKKSVEYRAVSYLYFTDFNTFYCA
jgi:cobalamin biosynthesis protein CobT